MGGKGGGSWKVAYADFVTAMMAFFLVMWIGSQDQKTKQAVANYFVDPGGAARKPAKTGSVFDSLSYGSVASNNNVMMGKGRNTYTTSGEPSPSTKLVNDFLVKDKPQFDYWKAQAAIHRERALQKDAVRENRMTVDEAAQEGLAQQLQLEIKRDIGLIKTTLYQELLFQSFNEVNWKELAEDVMKR